MAPNAQTPTEKLLNIFTGLKNRNLEVRVQYAQELRRFVSLKATIRHRTTVYIFEFTGVDGTC
jgi:hypothetical protein